jgi:hypothetical protein
MDSTVTGTVSEGVLFNRAVRKVFWEASPRFRLFRQFPRSNTGSTTLTPPLELELATAIAVYGSTVGIRRNGAAAQDKMKMHLLVMAKEVSCGLR